MPQTNHRGYHLLCRGLLGYLFVLNMIGFSWHLHSHQSDTTHASFSSEHEEFSLFSDDRCQVCDWLVQHTYHGSTSLHVATVIYPEGIPLSSSTHTLHYFWIQQYQPSRAPPSLS